VSKTIESFGRRVTIERSDFAVVQKREFMKTIVFAILLVMVVSGCSSSVVSNSESYYQKQPRRPINWREYLTD
jgi:outer membrane PBP1 activator LpoA protein